MTGDAAVADKADLSALAEEAVVWGLPLVMMARYLAAAEEGVPFNRFFMSTQVASPGSASIGPNIDTLNGRAWLDLDDGPVVIGVPDTADRYYSVHLQDLYANSFAYLGRRTTGTAAGVFAVTPPGWAGTLPEGMGEVRATTTKVLAMVRTMVSGADDLPAVRAINGQFTLGRLADYPNGQVAATVADGAIDAFQPASRRSSQRLPHHDIAELGVAFFDELDAAVKRFPPLPADAPNLARFAALGLGGQARTVGEDVLAAAVPVGVHRAQTALATRPVNGWMRRDNVEPIIADPLQRAANNLYGPNTQISLESVFWNLRRGPDGEALDGANRYRLRFAEGQLPRADAFWSLTLYDANYVLFANPIDRYGITSHMDGLVLGPDGSLDIRVQADPPEDPSHNWLPSPRDGFQLVIRTYQPTRQVLDGRYAPPPLEIVGVATTAS